MATETQGKKSYKDSLNLPQTSFPMEAKLVQNEPLRLKKWQEMNLYHRLLEARAKQGKGKWILHDGPPFANNDIHIGHVINKNLKDVIIRFRTMEGYETPYVPGWDCHGLPIEHKIQEEIKKEGKHIRDMSTLEVRKRCYEYADKYAAIQSEQFQRLGILGDWANPYLTMRPFYESQTLEVFARFVEAGLVYKRLKPVPWSVANQTALADAELEYKDVEDPSVYVEFALDPGTEVAKKFSQPVFLLVWTTTPWTLPANLAVAVHADVQYALVEYTKNGQQRVGIVARDLVQQVLSNRQSVQNFRVLDQTMSGAELAERAEYLHPFIERKGRVVTADYVTTTDGTGLVHTAPGHGEDDYETGVRHGMEVYSPVKHDGRFDDTVPEFLRGKSIKEGNPLIITELEKVGRLLAVQNIVHSYPHDWRSKTPIIFRATEQWFVAMDKPKGTGDSSLRDLAMDAVANKVQFIPAWGKARLEGMVQSRPDWCISRQRAWGLPIPVFYNEKGDALLTPQSVRAVAQRFAEKGSDAWFTDSPAELLGTGFRYPPGFEASTLRKEKDIFDVWFESGSSWRAVLQCRDNLHYPADLYLEGSDQHRGWFQLSLLPALGATGQPPFKAVLTHGFVVKPDGTKVSKSDKEYVTATQEVNRHGSDLLRLWCCSVDYQNDIPASPDAIKAFGDKYRKIRNTLKYLLSNLYDFNPQADAIEPTANSLDGWAMAELDQLIVEVKAAYDGYQLHRAFRLLHDFCAVQISAIYGNAMKDRLYCDVAASPARRRCQTVLHRMALALTKLLAPMLVYTADETWEHIVHKPAHDRDLASVHLALLPEPSGMKISESAREEWKILMDLRSQALLELDQHKKQVGLNKALDAEVIYQVPNGAMRQRLQAYGSDLEDLVAAGFHSFADQGGSALAIKTLDRRNDYGSCARCWKRRPDVGKEAEFAELCHRCAAAVRWSS
ncbi:MAG TPA: isoleucine--tRNA ligase [Tepidisphaeraceae bacterium]|nr:isoleucine--tRNA ligase [Tepidisphaeraceae bacterium]